MVVLFVGPNCNELCDGIRKALNTRSVSFEEIDLAGPDGRRQNNKDGVELYPTTLTGKVKV